MNPLHSLTSSSSPPAWSDRFKAAGIHLALSLIVAGLTALIVFGLWYPYPYTEISGGTQLFFLIVIIDVILGPLLTFAVFNKVKGWVVLRRDLAVILTLQLAALAYGMWTVAIARPVYLVLEYNRFRPVHAYEVVKEQLPKAPDGLQTLTWFGPKTIGMRKMVGNEVVISTTEGVAGAAQPMFWQAMVLSEEDIKKNGKPMTELLSRFPREKSRIEEAVSKSGVAANQLMWFPGYGRDDFWTYLLDQNTLKVVGYLKIDSF